LGVGTLLLQAGNFIDSAKTGKRFPKQTGKKQNDRIETDPGRGIPRRNRSNI